MRNIFSVILGLILIGLLVAILFFLFYPQLEFSRIGIKDPKISEIFVERKITTASPLRVLNRENSIESFLTQQGIIKETNTQRVKNGLSELKENSRLDLMAQAKIDDMFGQGYFDHYSPLGEGVGDLADKFNYEFIAIGENLAMGNFENDKVLVIAWMESPEHRANILNSKYKEIGVAVQKGVLDGNSVWLAVQHFGFSALDCFFPSENLKNQIENNEEKIKEKEILINKIQSELKTIKQRWGTDYQGKIEEYNKLVEEYNNLLAINRDLVEQYNSQVYNFNICIEG